MKKDCLDIGIIQAFLDGELASDQLDTAAHHLSVCDDCALQMAAAEEESAIVFSALEQEFNTLVPTRRLWAKINDSIEKERKSFWKPIFAFLKNPAIASFASLLIVFGIFMAYLNSQANENKAEIAINKETKEITPSVFTPVSAPVPSADDKTNPDSNNQDKMEKEPAEKAKTEFRTVKADFKNTETIRKPFEKSERNPQVKPVVYQYLPGEESYLKTISALEKNVNSTKDQALNPSARFTYEQNLALVNDAITKMRAEVRKNPKNESAKQILMASYQNKVDLLNSVNGKNELIASMR